MKVLLLNQFFPPDHAPTGQMAAELGEDLVRVGFQVTAVASRGRYSGGDPLPARDTWNGIEVRRLRAFSQGRKGLLHRALDYGSFHASAAAAMALLPRHDVVVAMTTPPLIAATALLARARHGSRLVYWVQDLYPEVAVAFGALRPGSLAERSMAAVSRRLMRSADRVVALGEAMRERCIDAGAPPERVTVIPNWADGEVIRPVPHAENPLRPEIAGGARFVAMYSGNIGKAHDVETIAGAARILRDRKDVAFVIVGEGARRAELEAATRSLPNVRFLPSRPRNELSALLSAADVHLVTLSPSVVGLLEPSKLYGAMAVGRPIVYVGPLQAEVARTVVQEQCGVCVANGDAGVLGGAISAFAADAELGRAMGDSGRRTLIQRRDRRHSTQSFAALLTSMAGDPAVAERGKAFPRRSGGGSHGNGAASKQEVR